MRRYGWLLALTLLTPASPGRAEHSQLGDFATMMRLARLSEASGVPVDPEMNRELRLAMIRSRMASPGSTIYYRNGRVATHYANQAGATLYYPNGTVATHYALQPGATWYYPNGAVATHYVSQAGGTWYYASGGVATHYAGQVGATWYYPSGRVISHYMGQTGATWYFDDGSVMFSSGPVLSASDLMNVPHVLYHYVLLLEADE